MSDVVLYEAAAGFPAGSR